jgi:hypothetical protein
MPQCPHCQTPFEEGQRYCKVCGSFLLHPEEGDTFCPQCGIRVSPRQEFCHECDAPLKGGAAPPTSGPAPEAGPPEASPGPPPPPVQKPQTWLIGGLVGAGVVIIVLLVLLFTRGTAPPPALTPPAETPAPAAPQAPQTQEESATQLKADLQKILSTLREAQLHKNIDLFMGVYSPAFPGLDQKAKDTLAAWKNYDYLNLVFTIDDLKPIDADNAVATVTWYIDTKNLATQEINTYTQTYQVRFVKESGQWRIRALEEVE